MNICINCKYCLVYKKLFSSREPVYFCTNHYRQDPITGEMYYDRCTDIRKGDYFNSCLYFREKELFSFKPINILKYVRKFFK